MSIVQASKNHLPIHDIKAFEITFWSIPERYILLFIHVEGWLLGKLTPCIMFVRLTVPTSASLRDPMLKLLLIILTGVGGRDLHVEDLGGKVRVLVSLHLISILLSLSQTHSNTHSHAVLDALYAITMHMRS